ncbi:MAG: EamA family transporter [Armatimonadetes bacterium]|nr:EamA family transporter [Armatimonadota bacterium]
MRKSWYLAAALGVVYVAWGSTFLAIKVGLESIPPYTLMGVRFLLAGSLLYALARSRGEVPYDPRSWRDAAVLAFLLLVCGAGAVAWAEQWVPSGLAALLGASSPLWVQSLDGRRQPSGRVLLGLLVGFAGVALLVGSSVTGADRVALPAMAVLLLSALAWAGGILLSSRTLAKGSELLRSGSQMLLAGLMLCALAGLSGEQMELARISSRSLLALLYLTVVGSLLGFSAFSWLARNASPAVASTHSYVNPVIAMALGTTLGGESLALSAVLAALLALAGVALILGAPPGGGASTPFLPRSPFRPRRPRWLRTWARRGPAGATGRFSALG